MTSMYPRPQAYNEIPFEPQVYDPYPKYSSAEYLETHYPVQKCYLDDDGAVSVPNVYAYRAIPQYMTAPLWGSYELLGIAPDTCWDRFGRFGPYGYGYPPTEGGLGLDEHSERLGAEKIEQKSSNVDYRGINWGRAQKKCHDRNRLRFGNRPDAKSHTSREKTPTKRSAFVLRAWTGLIYSDTQLLSLRAAISELSLRSGGEYDVHFLVHVKDDRIPIWASEDVYNKTLEENVPEEFWEMTTLWSEQQMRTYYPGPFPDDENMVNNAKTDVYGVYRSAHFALQWFAQTHPEYDFFWNWEMDVRYSGHYYEFHEAVSKWAAAQPRKLLWERSSKFWIPDVHGTWANFSNYIANETMASARTPIWGPVNFPTSGLGKPSSPAYNFPPTTFEDDDFAWGVGEDADLIVFDPLFEPNATTWVFREDVTGYDLHLEPPPRRAALVTIGRLSKRLLQTMHEETYRYKHLMFPEMWPPSIALHHGFKAVYVPHPVYFDRAWPMDVLDQTFNHPRRHDDSPFGGGEHNFQGSSFYYNSGFSGALWRRWLGARENGEGGLESEVEGSGRMCLRSTLHHPIKFEHVD